MGNDTVLTTQFGLKDHIRVLGDTAALMADLGRVVFGPGPRKWTFTFPGYTAVFEIDHVESEDGDAHWCLRKLKEVRG